MKPAKSLAATLAIFGATLAAPAMAEPIMLDADDIGQDFTVEYDGFVDGQTIDGLSALTIFTLTGINGTTYTFDYSVKNTSGSGVDARISSFAFNTDPEITGADATGTYNFTVTDSKYPNGIGSVDVCFKGGKSGSCAGNKGGLFTGETGTGTLSLDFLTAPTSITLDDFFVRYQSVSGVPGVGSASGQQTSTTSTGGTTTTTTTTTSTSGGTPVPAPGGMLALLALALASIGLLGRRRRVAASAQSGAAFA